MARYDYRCTICGDVFEVEHGMGDHPVITCPTCAGKADKLFNASGIKFSGSGFYNTDMRGKTSSTSTGDSNGPCGCDSCPHKSE